MTSPRARGHHLQRRDVGDGELLAGLNLVLGLQRQRLVGEHGVAAVGGAGVGHEAERGEDRLRGHGVGTWYTVHVTRYQCADYLPPAIAAGKCVGPEEAHAPVEVPGGGVGGEGGVALAQEGVDGALVGGPQLGLLHPVLVVVHEVAEPLPHLRHLLLHLHQPQRRDGAVVVVRVRGVAEVYLALVLAERAALDHVRLAARTRLVTHRPPAPRTPVAPVHRLEALRTAH